MLIEEADVEADDAGTMYTEPSPYPTANWDLSGAISKADMARYWNERELVRIGAIYIRARTDAFCVRGRKSEYDRAGMARCVRSIPRLEQVAAYILYITVIDFN